MSLLEVDSAAVEFQAPGGTIRALDGVSLTVERAETMAVVGESGCGKTTLARAVLGLQALTSGSVRLLGEEVISSRKNAERVGMVWQDPYASLDPRWTVSKSILEPSRIARKSVDVATVLDEVGLDPKFGSRFPHQLSGGQRQRVAIGRALSLRPPLVICDEPTAALDLSVRAQILNLLRDLQRSIGCSFLYISHDLTTVRYLADRVAVMYLGRIVEVGSTKQIFESPRHPYTNALLESAPSLERMMHLPNALTGELPDPRTKFQGCRFAGRCPNMQKDCIIKDPGQSGSAEHAFFCNYPLGEASAAASTL